jgi:hypothetical protein
MISLHAWSHSRSLTLNLEGGFAAYAQRLNDKRDASLLKKVETNERKLAKKFGALSFTMDSRSATEFDALLAGKSAQFTRTLVLSMIFLRRHGYVMLCMEFFRSTAQILAEYSQVYMRAIR